MVLSSIKSWIQHNWLFGLVFALSIFLRFWNLENSMQFLGDQGRDAIIVAKIFTQGDLVFIGPVSSVGNVYLGPLYYYFMVPFLWLTYPNPVGPAYAVAMISSLSVLLIYEFNRRIFGKSSALIAAVLLGLCTVSVSYGRFSWNPNPAVFFGLLLPISIYLSLRRSPKWLWLSGLCCAVLIQLHYLTLLAIAATGLIWIFQLWKSISAKRNISDFLIGTGLAATIMVISLIPLFLFDLKHEWLNSRFILSIFSKDSGVFQQSQNIGTGLIKSISEIEGRSFQLFFENTFGKNRIINRILMFSLFGLWVAWIKTNGRRSKSYQLWANILSTYTVVGLLGLAVYRNSVFSHYILFLLPISFSLMAGILGWIWQHLIGKVAVILLGIGFISFSFSKWPIQSLGWKLSDIQQVAQRISAEIPDQTPYSIVLLSSTHDIEAQNYRYFLLNPTRTLSDQNKPVNFAQNSQANVLVIINEEKIAPDPTNLPIFEIASFPHLGITKTIEINNGPQLLFLNRQLSPESDLNTPVESR